MVECATMVPQVQQQVSLASCVGVFAVDTTLKILVRYGQIKSPRNVAKEGNQKGLKSEPIRHS